MIMVQVHQGHLLSPLNVLSKGYSLVTCEGTVIKDTKDLKVDDSINIRFHKGNVKAVVKEIEKND